MSVWGGVTNRARRLPGVTLTASLTLCELRDSYSNHLDTKGYYCGFQRQNPRKRISVLILSGSLAIFCLKSGFTKVMIMFHYHVCNVTRCVFSLCSATISVTATSDLFCLLLLPSLLLSCCPPLLFLPPLLLHLPPSLLGTALQLLLHASLFVLQRLQQFWMHIYTNLKCKCVRRVLNLQTVTVSGVWAKTAPRSAAPDTWALWRNGAYEHVFN